MAAPHASRCLGLTLISGCLDGGGGSRLRVLGLGLLLGRRGGCWGGCALCAVLARAGGGGGGGGALLAPRTLRPLALVVVARPHATKASTAAVHGAGSGATTPAAEVTTEVAATTHKQHSIIDILGLEIGCHLYVSVLM